MTAAHANDSDGRSGPMSVSVAMGVLDGGRYLRAQLDSVRVQTRPPDELVICDDGSSDDTVAIAAEFAAEAPFPVRVEVNARRLGPRENTLRALRLCTGDVRAIADADDVWMPNKLERTSSWFARPDVLLVMHTVLLVDAELRQVGGPYPKIRRAHVAPPLSTDPWFPAHGTTMVIHRRLLSLLDPGSRPFSDFDEREPMLHDQWFYFLAGTAGKIAFLPEPLGFYRQHDRNVTGAREQRFARRALASFHVGAEAYRRSAEHMRARVAVLSSAGTRADGEFAERLEQGARFYRKLAERIDSRAELYSLPTRRDRAAALLRLVGDGGYRSRRAGGLGATALAKDAAATVLPTIRDVSARR